MKLFKEWTLWLRFVFIALGHPGIFISFVLLFVSSESIFGIESFRHMGMNVYRINLLLFSVFSFLIYAAWILLQISILNLFRKIDMETFIKGQFSGVTLIICAMGIWNLLEWGYGISGYAFWFFGCGWPPLLSYIWVILEQVTRFCFFVSPHLIILTFFMFMTFLYQVFLIYRGKYDLP